MRRTARWSYRHRRAVVGIWLVAAIGFTVFHAAVGSDYSDSFRLKGTESAEAVSLLQASSPRNSGDVDRIVIATSGGRTVGNQAVRARVERMLAQVARLPHVGAVQSPYAPGAADQVSRDGETAFATITFDDQTNDLKTGEVKRVVATAQRAAGDGIDIELGGDAIEAANSMSVSGIFFGFVAAAIVLFFVFRSLLAMATPLLTAAFALSTGIAIQGLLSHVMTIASFSSELSLLIGLGVGVDYALFIVTRYRQGLLRGLSSEEAAVEALDTAGRAVLFAGVTVCIALLGMFALGVSFLYGLAVSGSIVVAFTVITALTLLPALLGFMNMRLLSRRQRLELAEQGQVTASDEAPGWARWAGFLGRRPAIWAIGAAVVMLVIALPFLSIRLGSSDQGSDPASTTTRKAYDLLARGFGPGFNGALQLVARVPDRAAVAQFALVVDAARATPGVVAVTPPSVLRSHGRPTVAVADVFPASSPQDASTSDLLHTLQETTIPRSEGNINVLVGGSTALFQDFTNVLSGRLPLFVGVIVALSFLLLAAVFRSLLVPAKAAVMNLISVAAAFGVITAVFQKGWGAALIGVGRTGPIEAFLPVIVFAVLFGLSMDYEVFLVSRIYEEWHRRGDNREAVLHGLAATGRTITAAAAIMVLVFAAFVLGGQRIIKLFGVGLASAVFLDAVVIRSALVPSLMLLAGRANWWLPGWLERLLPRLNVEGRASRTTQAAARKANAGVPGAEAGGP